MNNVVLYENLEYSIFFQEVIFKHDGIKTPCYFIQQTA